MCRILLITSRSPFPPINGGRQRTYHLHRALSTYGKVDTILVGDVGPIEGDGGAAIRERFGIVAHRRPQPRGKRGLWRLARPLAPGLIDRLAHNLGRRAIEYGPDPSVAPMVRQTIAAGNYDILVTKYLTTAAQSGALGYAPHVVDLDDLDTQVFQSRLQAPGVPGWKRAAYRFRIRQLERVATPCLRRCSHVWVSAEEDRAALEADRSSVLPNIPYRPVTLPHGRASAPVTLPYGRASALVTLPYGRASALVTLPYGRASASESLPSAPLPDRPESRAIVFVGSMSHRENVRAVEWFLKEVWPAVHRAEPQTVFRIVGSGMADRLRAAWSAVPGTDVLGYVDDLAGVYDACAFTVAPFFEGGGSKIKVLESLSYGRTVIATPHATRGYGQALRHGEALWLAGGAEAFYVGCLVLLRKIDLRAALARYGHEVVSRQFCYPVFEGIVHRTLEQFVGRGPIRTRPAAEFI
jgi:glycosyltransferase involved in cell wall biosynthesis